MEIIEAEFLDITKSHLHFWNDTKKQQYKYDALSAKKFGEAALGKTSRQKRSGIEKVLQVSIID